MHDWSRKLHSLGVLTQGKSGRKWWNNILTIILVITHKSYHCEWLLKYGWYILSFIFLPLISKNPYSGMRLLDYSVLYTEGQESCSLRQALLRRPLTQYSTIKKCVSIVYPKCLCLKLVVIVIPSKTVQCCLSSVSLRYS